MNTLNSYPFDLHCLEKGSVIQSEEIERLSGVQRHLKRFSLELLNFKALLERQWLMERGEVITTRIHHDCIVICTDDDAVATNCDRANAGVRTLHSALHRQNGVDRSNLSEEVRHQHERELVRLPAFLAGGYEAEKKALAPTPYKRNKPGLLAK
jgi:hypothetical protein